MAPVHVDEASGSDETGKGTADQPYQTLAFAVFCAPDATYLTRKDASVTYEEPTQSSLKKAKKGADGLEKKRKKAEELAEREAKEKKEERGEREKRMGLTSVLRGSCKPFCKMATTASVWRSMMRFGQPAKTRKAASRVRTSVLSAMANIWGWRAGHG